MTKAAKHIYTHAWRPKSPRSYLLTRCLILYQDPELATRRSVELNCDRNAYLTSPVKIPTIYEPFYDFGVAVGYIVFYVNLGRGSVRSSGILSEGRRFPLRRSDHFPNGVVANTK
jgi:hypothetical protein